MFECRTFRLVYILYGNGSFQFIVFQFLRAFKFNKQIEIRWTLGGSVNIKHFSDAALLDSMDVCVRPITLVVNESVWESLKTNRQYKISFIKFL